MDYTCIWSLSVSVHEGEDKISSGYFYEVVKKGKEKGRGRRSLYKYGL